MKNTIKINTLERTVCKTFRSRIAKDRESTVLTLLSGTGMVPELIAEENFDLTTELIDGIILSDIFINGKDKKVDHVIEKLADWIKAFDEFVFDKTDKYICLEDINPRNFIYNKKTDKIIGIDFEAWHLSDKSENMILLPVLIKTSYFFNNDIAYSAFIKAKKISSDFYICDIESKIEAEIEKTIYKRKIMKEVRKCDCVIIAGGKSSRMGTPKGLLLYNGYTFTDWLVYAAQIFDNVYISANLPEYNSFNCKLISDIYKDKGPMGAVYAALKTTEKETVFFLPCDTPFITEKTIFELFSKADLDASCNILQNNGRMYPTIGIYSKKILEIIEKYIRENNLRMMNLLGELNTKYITAGCQYELKNINTVEDYNELFC